MKINNGLATLFAGAEKEKAWLSPLLTGLFLLIFALYPRLAQLGAYVEMDEGSYSFISALFAEDYVSRSVYGLSLYPLLLSWVYLVPGNATLLLRICDMLCALAMFATFLKILQRESGNWLVGIILGVIFLAPMSSPEVMDAGFKNSIPVSLFCFFSAWLIGAGRKSAKSPAWFLVGALTALGVLLRESFFLFSLLGVIAVFTAWGVAACWRFICGAIALTLGIIGVYHFFWYADGGILPFIDGYIGRGNFYANESWRILSSFIIRKISYLNLFGFQALLFIGAYLMRPNSPGLGKSFWFWLLTAPLALLELLSKPGFAYHLAVCMPGLAVCVAILWQYGKPLRLEPKPWAKRGLYGFFISCLFVAFAHSFMLLPGYASLERTFLAFSAQSDKNSFERYKSQSQILELIAAIYRHNPKPSSLVASGFSFFLYPASGLMPPRIGTFDPEDKYRLADLSRSYVSMGKDGKRLQEEIRKNQPEFIALGVGREDHESDYHEDLIALVENSGLYELVEFIPWSGRSYGFMAYLLYQLKN